MRESGDKVKALSPHHRLVIALHSLDGVGETSSGDTQCGRVATKSRRFRHIMLVIALHSLDGVGETGLRVCPAEKNTAKLGCGVKQDTFSGPVSGRQSQNCAHFQRFLGEGSRVSLQSRLHGGGRRIRTPGTVSVQPVFKNSTGTHSKFKMRRGGVWFRSGASPHHDDFHS